MIKSDKKYDIRDKLRKRETFGPITSHESPITQKGFSLFEILIVIVIFAIIVFVADQSFISSLKSGKKSDLQQKVKSNSNYIFSVMERQLHSARSVTTCSGLNGNTNSSTISYKDTNNVAQSFSFTSGSNGIFTSSALGLLTSPDITVNSGSITCSTTNGVTTVTVNLSLRQSGSTTGLRAEEQDTFQTQTQITLRNN